MDAQLRDDVLCLFRRFDDLTLVFAGLVLIGFFVQSRTPVLVAYTSPIVLEFAAGGWIGILWKRAGPWHRSLGWPSLIVSVALLVAFGIGKFEQPQAVFYGIPAGLLLISTLALERRHAVGKYRVPQLLGDASYSIYLWHAVGISVSVKFCEKLHLPTTSIVPSALVSGIIVGIVCFQVIERPLMIYLRRRRRTTSILF